MTKTTVISSALPEACQGWDFQRRGDISCGKGDDKQPKVTANGQGKEKGRPKELE